MNINQIVLNTAAVTAPPPAPERKPGTHRFTINLKGPKVRFETLENIQYMVVPMVMLTEGVHNGSMGPLYYPGEELAKTPVAWNMKPIVVYHPQVNGQGVSACTPDVINTRKIGVVMSTAYEGGKLKAEAWLDPVRTKAVDERILNAVEKGQMVELSTGLFTDNEMSDGEWKGEKYVAIARNYRADHLAILPDLVGACSIKDGAGLLRNAISYDQIRQRIQGALKDEYGQDVYCYVEDVFDGFFIFQKGSSFFQQNYTTTDTAATLVGEPVEVVKVIQYRTLTGSVVGNKQQEATNVNKVQMVALLVANVAGGWGKADEDWLMKQDEKRLERFVANLKEEKKEDVKVEPIIVGNQDKKVEAAPPKPATFEEYVNNAPPEMRDVLRSSVRMHATERQRLVGVITANTKNIFKPDFLATKSLEELQGLAALAAPAPTANDSIFLGLGDMGRGQGITENVEECLELPTLNETKPKATK